MGLSPFTLRIIARGIYRAVLLIGLRSRPLIYYHYLSVYSLFSQIKALSYKRITADLPYPSSFTLDRTRFPRENISETREISED
jgi:hypothetical protein